MQLITSCLSLFAVQELLNFLNAHKDECFTRRCYLDIKVASCSGFTEYPAINHRFLILIIFLIFAALCFKQTAVDNGSLCGQRDMTNLLA